MKTAFPQRKYIQAPCLLDFYKCFHALAYKKGASEVTINFTGRSGNHSNIKGGKTYRWAGLQGFINNIIVTEWNKFFDAPLEDAIADYKRVNEGGLGVPCDTSKLEELHALGYMPLEFRALLEGLEVPYGVAALTCRNTDDRFYFLPNMIETILSDEIWPVQTSLTTAAEYMKTVKEFAAIDGTPEFLIPFLGHDFSMRGMMGGRMEGGATLSGQGHLMSGFVGSDTIPAALELEKNYNAYLGLDRPFETIASVNATEHSVQCSFNNDDMGYFKHCMEVAPQGILSLVSDGYDFWKLVTDILPQLKDMIMVREGKIVIRPDSGDPADVICGLSVKQYPDLDYLEDDVREEMQSYCGQGEMCGDTWEGVVYLSGEVRKVKFSVEVLGAKQDIGDKVYWVEDVRLISNEPSELTPQQKGLVETLWDMFGGTQTEERYKMLDEHIGTIYGDSITLERQRDIYTRLHKKGFAIANVVLGIGSYTYQYVTRDTHGSAVKATNMIIDGVDTPISKEVKGDAVKKSAKGRLVVRDTPKGLVQFDEASLWEVEQNDNMHQLVWKDGVWFRTQTLEDVRNVVNL